MRIKVGMVSKTPRKRRGTMCPKCHEIAGFHSCSSPSLKSYDSGDYFVRCSECGECVLYKDIKVVTL